MQTFTVFLPNSAASLVQWRLHANVDKQLNLWTVSLFKCYKKILNLQFLSSVSPQIQPSTACLCLFTEYVVVLVIWLDSLVLGLEHEHCHAEMTMSLPL